MLKLNLGCGKKRLEGFVNIDCAAQCEPDVVLNLGWDRLPYPNGSVDEIRATHVLEHIDDLSYLMQECHRVLIQDGLFRITVPHHCSDGFWGDPTHVRPITAAGLALYSKTKCDEAEAKGWANTPLAYYLDIDFEIDAIHLDLHPAWKDKAMDKANLEHCIRSYNNVVNEVSFVLRKV